MATTLSAQNVVLTGLLPVYTAADATGNNFLNDGMVFLHVKNGDVASKTVTLTTPNLVEGIAIADPTVVIPAGEDRMIGPFPTGPFNDSSGKANVTYSAVTSVTVALVRMVE
jgi:hypothetical protein